MFRVSLPAIIKPLWLRLSIAIFGLQLNLVFGGIAEHFLVRFPALLWIAEKGLQSRKCCLKLPYQE
jgi:hypothetical protein